MAKKKQNPKTPKPFLDRVRDQVQKDKLAAQGKDAAASLEPLMKFRKHRISGKVAEMCALLTHYAYATNLNANPMPALPSGNYKKNRPTPFGYVLGATLDAVLTDSDKEILMAQFTEEEIAKLVEKNFKPVKQAPEKLK
jgi:hypothetical protein